MRWTLVLRPARRRQMGDNARCGGLHLIRPGVLASAGPPSPQGEGRTLFITAAEGITPLISSSRISLSLASAQARKLARSIAPPLPTKTALLGFRGGPICPPRPPLAHRRVSRFPSAFAAENRDTSSKSARCIRHRRRFADFPRGGRLVAAARLLRTLPVPRPPQGSASP